MVNYNDNFYSRRGTNGREHIPGLPFWVAVVRILQLLFAFLVMVLTAFASSTFSSSADVLSSLGLEALTFTGFYMSWFTFVWTILFLLYIFVTPLWFPKWYLYWAHLGLEFLTVIFWLTTFALLADAEKFFGPLQYGLNIEKTTQANEQASGKPCSTASPSSSTIPGLGNIPGLPNIPGLTLGPNVCIDFTKEESAIKAARAAMGLSVITWLLFVLTFIVFSFFLHKHRVEHGSSGFGGLTISRKQPTDNAQVEKAHPQTELRDVQEHKQPYQAPPEQQHQAPAVQPYEGA